MPSELSLPPGASSDPEAVEIARVWIVQEQQHATLRVNAWGDEPSVWGVLLVDLARHVARAHSELYGRPEGEILARIRQAFDAEWANPTDDGKGSFVGR